MSSSQAFINPVLMPEFDFLVWGEGSARFVGRFCTFIKFTLQGLSCLVSQQLRELLREVPTSLTCAKLRLRPGLFSLKPGLARGRELNPNIFFSNFSGASGISRQNPGISRQKSLIPWVSRDIPNFLAPTHSRGRPPPHPKISGLKSLGLGSFFVPD